MTEVITADGLALATPAGRLLVEGLSFRLGAGQVLAVSGPNGVGKSTLLRVLLGAAPAAGGTLQVAPAPERIGYLPQLAGGALHLPLTLRDVLGLATPGRLAAAAVAAIGLLQGIDLGRAWNFASGGERQRTLLTAELLKEPALLLLDEPLNHLDPAGAGHLRAALDAYVGRGGRAAVVVSHAPWDAADAPLLRLALAEARR